MSKTEEQRNGQHRYTFYLKDGDTITTEGEGEYPPHYLGDLFRVGEKEGTQTTVFVHASQVVRIESELIGVDETE